jgi:hypothetical protein
MFLSLLKSNKAKIRHGQVDGLGDLSGEISSLAAFRET